MQMKTGMDLIAARAVIENPLDPFWNQPVSKLATVQPVVLNEEMKERHRIYSLLLMSAVSHYWNGNKKGPTGNYPWREAQRLETKRYAGGDYLGHNIACIAVDGLGQVIDFDFNHNELFNSSVEHAESRLVRRVFSLTPLYDDWETRDLSDAKSDGSYSTILSNVTIYTSLESCAQCAGMMALGRVKEIVYLQRDPGMYLIGNILHNLTKDSPLRSPLPISGAEIGLSFYAELNERYAQFVEGVQTLPFYRQTDKKDDHSNSITSFLCTDLAKDVFDRGFQTFQDLQKATYDDFQPDASIQSSTSKILTNQEVLTHTKRFKEFVVKDGRRGTPHQL